MPLYEFQCKKCSETFTELMQLNAEPPACPKCKTSTCERTLTTHAGYSIQGPNQSSTAKRRRR